ncbi:speckle-type POZ protein [Caerostris darwini]|uniref:Speckle-type POZ protein n=1 Tax=Caerostris darwini TaxID=1538125 RepID=A0AAV4Q426_9ARAC|nr:speckle-type POZ protein [Caerostris darwini]
MVTETSSYDQYQFTYVWTIYDFVLCPQLQGSAIISQTFVVYELGGTSWRLYLYPRGKTNPDYVLVYLYRESNGCWKNQVVVDLKISIENGEGVQISCKLANNVLFEENDIWKGIQFLKREKLMWFLQNSNSNTLILRCEMSVNIATDICKWSEYTDLQALSDDLLNLHKGEVFTDARLQCENATIDTHKCILAARLSQLSLQLELSVTKHEMEKINTTHIPTSLMKILLCYAYSGKLDLPLSEIPADLYSIASRFRITDLIQKLKSYPKLCYYYTFLNVEQSCFVWRLKKRNVTEGNSTCLVRIVPTESLYVDNVNVSCTIKTNLKDNFVEDINIAFYIDDIQENIPIFLSCNVFATT